MTSNSTLLARRQQAVPRGVGNITPLFADRAENAEVWDVEGKRYVDFAAGIAVVNTGHLHPKVKAAVQKQLERFSHTCFHVMMYEPYVALAERLNALVPGDSPKKTLLVSTGAEAVENAIKFARVATGRSGVIAFGGAFHGRTIMAVSLTGKMEPYKAGFGPFPAEVFHAPYPNALYGVSVNDAIAGVEQLFKSDIEPNRVAAIIIEPVQGEGGFYIAPPEFLQRLRALCDQHGILLICDEVQTGFARTGRLFATEYAGIEADIMILAKGLAGGFPLAAVVGKSEVLEAVGPGGVGGTYGGNPLSCVAALAVLDVIEEEGLVARANAQGARLRQRLEGMAHKHECIGDVRGLGAMVAIELFHDVARKQPAADLTKALVSRAAEKGLLLLSCGHNGNVIRILAPLTAPDDIIDEGLSIIEEALEELAPAAVAEAVT
jgi:4-aminobutyrate aminotransferase/(S)-3-amino-2-methylpropionate transaminase